MRHQARFYGRMARLFALGTIKRPDLPAAKRVLIAASYARAAAHCYFASRS